MSTTEQHTDSSKSFKLDYDKQIGYTLRIRDGDDRFYINFDQLVVKSGEFMGEPSLSLYLWNEQHHACDDERFNQPDPYISTSVDHKGDRKYLLAHEVLASFNVSLTAEEFWQAVKILANNLDDDHLIGHEEKLAEELGGEA